MPMNLEDVQVVDKILSKVAFGYTNNALAGHHLFPHVTVQNYVQTLMQYDKSAFVTHNYKRAPGSNVKEVVFAYGSEKISLTQDAGFALVPKEWLKAVRDVPTEDLQIRAVNILMAQFYLGLEKEHAAIAQNEAGYANTHKVTLTASDSFANPTTDTSEVIDDLKETVRKSIGRDPNTILVPKPVKRALKRNEDIRDRFKFHTTKSINGEMLSEYWDIENVVFGDSLSAKNEESETFDDVWQDVILAYVPPEAERDYAPAYGYTYRFDGHPMVNEFKFYDSKQSWRSYVEFERQAYQHGAGAGALIRNPLAQ